jgi:hypothetical protein
MCRSIDINATRLRLVEKEIHVTGLYDHYALAQFVFPHLYHCLRQSTPVDSWCRSYPTVMSFFGFRFVLQHSMTTFMKDVFVVDSDHEAGSLRSPCGHAVMRSCGHAVMRSCGHAVLRSCNKLFSDPLALDDTGFDEE